MARIHVFLLHRRKKGTLGKMVYFLSILEIMCSGRRALISQNLLVTFLLQIHNSLLLLKGFTVIHVAFKRYRNGLPAENVMLAGFVYVAK
jgi:hypothetical protein